jgi:hypothetical protein
MKHLRVHRPIPQFSCILSLYSGSSQYSVGWESLANAHWPLLGKILQFTEQGFDPLQDKIFSHLLDLTILNSFIVSCENVTSLRIMMEHAARNRTPALSSTISHLGEASGHWLISSAIRMLCHVCGVDWKQASQYLSVILHKYSILLVLVCLLSTPCLCIRSRHVTSGPQTLKMFVSSKLYCRKSAVQLYQSGNHSLHSALFIYRQLIYRHSDAV